jgi:hypothetical protein
MSPLSPAFTHLPQSVTPAFVPDDAGAGFEQMIHDCIGDRAYRIFEESGRINGHDAENWKQAESEILRNGLDVRDAGRWISVSGKLANVAPASVQILVRPRRVLIRADAPGQIFFAVELTSEVDPETAIASTKEGALKLMVRKRG